MPYTALPDMRMPYDNDGSVVGDMHPTGGVQAWLSGAEKIALNGYDYASISGSGGAIMFFPEQREVTACYIRSHDYYGNKAPYTSFQGSNDTANGLDGTWETATMGGGYPAWVNNYSWREGIKPVSFTGGKRTIRYQGGSPYLEMAHIYGEKVAGQTPDDIIYIDHETSPGVGYQAPEDVGDRPLGTTVTRQFRIKNTSGTKTANTVNIQCNDSDFVISTDNATWVVTINIGSLAAGAESSTMYVRNTTPNPGGLLGPRFARIITTVGSWT